MSEILAENAADFAEKSLAFHQQKAGESPAAVSKRKPGICRHSWLTLSDTRGHIPWLRSLESAAHAGSVPGYKVPCHEIERLTNELGDRETAFFGEFCPGLNFRPSH